MPRYGSKIDTKIIIDQQILRLSLIENFGAIGEAEE